jgi:hypothetical protein
MRLVIIHRSGKQNLKDMARVSRGMSDRERVVISCVNDDMVIVPDPFYFVEQTSKAKTAIKHEKRIFRRRYRA